MKVQVMLKHWAQQDLLFEGVVEATSTVEALRQVLALPRVQDHLNRLQQRTLCCSAKEVLS
jgi:hypothetical protein